jgi:hypothetical protein
MTKRWVCLSLSITALALFTRLPKLTGQSAADEASYSTAVLPVLSKSCFTCHNEKLKSGNLNLETYRDGKAASQQPQVWEKVLEKVASGKMPPPGIPGPSKAEAGALTNWIEAFLARTGNSRSGEPGRVMARRLNRVEYNNTIRDLLGVHIRPADEFPVDDSGYGFDNIGDVLSVSPMLMEKYLAAAARISRLAIFGEQYPAEPTKLIRLLNRRSPDGNDVLSNGNFGGAYFPYSMRGAMYGSWRFPVDGEYELRLRIANFRGDTEAKNLTDEERQRLAEDRRKRIEEFQRQRAAQKGTATPRPQRTVTPEQLKAQEEAARKGAPPRKLVLAVDGRPVFDTVVEGTTAYEYSRGEYVVRVPLKAGEHFLRASYPELADLKDPRENLNPDMRRQLFVDYLEIVGPFHPSSEPPESYKRIFVCGHPKGGHKPDCAGRIVQNLIERAYRRPVTKDEVDSKVMLVRQAQKQGDSFEEGVEVALQAVLASPNFLFRIERDPKPAPATPSSHAINEYELASRLSYFLWGSMPDDELFRAAKAQQLRKPGVLEQQVRRMMSDPKARNLVDNFAAQWLQLRNLGRTKPDPARFPTVDDELLDAMRRETSLFVEAVIREDRSIVDFIDAPFTYLNGPLARHYGIAGVDGEEFRRVQLDPERRGGVLTQGAILTVSSYPTRTSPPVRGKWVLENLLGTPPPPPPPNVPVLDESKLGESQSMRARMEQHRKDPTCAACHKLMDPIGFGLESYDAVGAWRTMDGKFSIDTSGTLPDGQTFQGAKDLKQILRAQSETFTRNLAEKLLTFAVGRGLESYDRAALDQICSKTAANGYKFSAMVSEIVNSKPFQMRSTEGGKP